MMRLSVVLEVVFFGKKRTTIAHVPDDIHEKVTVRYRRCTDRNDLNVLILKKLKIKK